MITVISAVLTCFHIWALLGGLASTPEMYPQVGATGVNQIYSVVCTPVMSVWRSGPGRIHAFGGACFVILAQPEAWRTSEDDYSPAGWTRDLHASS